MALLVDHFNVVFALLGFNVNVNCLLPPVYKVSLELIEILVTPSFPGVVGCAGLSPGLLGVFGLFGLFGLSGSTGFEFGESLGTGIGSGASGNF